MPTAAFCDDKSSVESSAGTEKRCYPGAKRDTQTTALPVLSGAIFVLVPSI